MQRKSSKQAQHTMIPQCSLTQTLVYLQVWLNLTSWDIICLIPHECFVLFLSHDQFLLHSSNPYTPCPRVHDDAIKWKRYPPHWPFVRGIHRSPVNSPHKGQWHGALMFSLICTWINRWVNNGEAGDLRCHRAHYDVTEMIRVTLKGMGTLDQCHPQQNKIKYEQWV